MRYFWFLIFLASTLHAIDNKELLEEVNMVRVKNGLLPLKYDQNLSNISQKWAAYLTRSNRFDHRSDLKSFLGTYSTITENLFKSNITPSAKRVINSWMNSSGHRENLLDKDTTIVGIGISSTRGIYIVVYNGADL